MTFFITNLHARAEGGVILNGVTLAIGAPEIHVIMGPNGSGKSTLAKVIMGHPGYKITRGTIRFNKKSITRLSPEGRARAGIFLAFQYPIEVPGVNMFSYLRAIYSARFEKNKPIKKLSPGATRKRSDDEGGVSVEEFQRIIAPILKNLQVKEEFLERSVNEGFSGGEKKKAEIIQMAVLRPQLIILDETDSGLDIDALRIVAQGVHEFRPKDSIVVIITHYQRILKYIKPDFVHVMKDGKIVESGGSELAKRLERKGYASLTSKDQK